MEKGIQSLTCDKKVKINVYTQRNTIVVPMSHIRAAAASKSAKLFCLHISGFAVDILQHAENNNKNKSKTHLILVESLSFDGSNIAVCTIFVEYKSNF